LTDDRPDEHPPAGDGSGRTLGPHVVWAGALVGLAGLGYAALDRSLDAGEAVAEAPVGVIRALGDGAADVAAALAPDITTIVHTSLEQLWSERQEFLVVTRFHGQDSRRAEQAVEVFGGVTVGRAWVEAHWSFGVDLGLDLAAHDEPPWTAECTDDGTLCTVTVAGYDHRPVAVDTGSMRFVPGDEGLLGGRLQPELQDQVLRSATKQTTDRFDAGDWDRLIRAQVREDLASFLGKHVLDETPEGVAAPTVVVRFADEVGARERRRHGSTSAGR
jgi:hypothetical protein